MLPDRSRTSYVLRGQSPIATRTTVVMFTLSLCDVLGMGVLAECKERTNLLWGSIPRPCLLYSSLRHAATPLPVSLDQTQDSRRWGKPLDSNPVNAPSYFLSEPLMIRRRARASVEKSCRLLMRVSKASKHDLVA